MGSYLGVTCKVLGTYRRLFMGSLSHDTTTDGLVRIQEHLAITNAVFQNKRQKTLNGDVLRCN
jgi:hypothetical protein